MELYSPIHPALQTALGWFVCGGKLEIQSVDRPRLRYRPGRLIRLLKAASRIRFGRNPFKFFIKGARELEFSLRGRELESAIPSSPGAPRGPY